MPRLKALLQGLGLSGKLNLALNGVIDSLDSCRRAIQRGRLDPAGVIGKLDGSRS